MIFSIYVHIYVLAVLNIINYHKYHMNININNNIGKTEEMLFGITQEIEPDANDNTNEDTSNEDMDNKDIVNGDVNNEDTDDPNFNILNTYLKFYKRHYGKPYHFDMFNDFNYDEPYGTNHCMETLQKHIDEYYNNARLDESYVTIYDNISSGNIDKGKIIYVLTLTHIDTDKKNEVNETKMCMTLLPLLRYVGNKLQYWKIDVIKC